MRGTPAITIPVNAKRPVTSFVPALADPEDMRRHARMAIEAATAAGAHYADVRVGDQRQFYCGEGWLGSRLKLSYSYGLRVAVDGTTAFLGGADPTPERLVAAARSAVASARGLAKIRKNIGSSSAAHAPAVSRAIAPAPVVTGEWCTPIEIDPFAVSPDDHVAALMGFQSLNDMVRGPVACGLVLVQWTAETRVFASSEGSLITQHLAHVLPEIGIAGFSQDPSIGKNDAIMVYSLNTVLPPSSAGFECVLGIALREQVAQAMDDLLPWTAYRTAPVDVGRKALVLDGAAFGTVLGATVIPALALDRVLGEEQDVSGTSFLAPPESVLGQPLFAPTLNVSVVTGGTHYGRRQWDDEGIPQRAFPVIERGAVVDYFASRATVSTLRDQFSLPSLQSLQPHGVLHATTAGGIPRPMPSACVAASAPNGPSSLLELAATIKDGIIVRGGAISGDQQGAGGALFNAPMFEIQNGKVTRRLLYGQLEFSTKALLKGITAVGGPGTVNTTTNFLFAGAPVTMMHQAVTAPAVHIRDGNLTSTTLRFS